VQQAANAIDQFVAGLDAAGYAQNALVRAAVERQFEITALSGRPNFPPPRHKEITFR